MTAVSASAGALIVPPRISTRTVLFWTLAGFIVFAALTGGGSRPDIFSLIVLRPVAVVVTVFAAWTLTREHLRPFRFACTLTAATFLLTLLHLVPLPPALWTRLPGHGTIAAIDALVDLGPIWRPLSVAPAETANALFSLFVPIGVLLLALRLDSANHQRLMMILVGIGLFGAVLSLFQLLGPPRGPLFLYRNTNYGVATGLFANRNHHALFLATLLPMLAAMVTLTRRSRRAPLFRYVAIGSAAFLLPLLLVTGSRLGMLAGALALASTPFLIRMERARSGDRRPRGLARHLRWLAGPRGLVAGGALAASALLALTIWMSRATSMQRLTEVGASDELRFKVWPVILDAAATYLPFGSGIGSFVPVFKIVEPDAILRPTYLNHAHNEPLEVLLTAGIPGAALMLLAVVGWAIAARRAFAASIENSDVLFARTGVIVVGLLGLGSLTDYPLRTPFLSAVLVIGALWSSGLGRMSAKRAEERASAEPIARL